MSRKWFFITLILLVTLILLAMLTACTPANPPGIPSGTQGIPPGPAAGNSGLIGSEWRLAALNGKEPLAGSTVTLRLENGKLSGSAGCNGYGGQFSVNGRMLSIQEVYATEMACMAPVGIMEQETAYLQTLAQAAVFQVTNDRLEIKNSAEQAILVFEK